MPKLTAFACERICFVTASVGTPNTCEAVTVWISSPLKKRLPHRLVARDVGEQPQLDLAVVRVHEHIAALGHEHPPQLAAERRARRDILQIRLGGAEPPVAVTVIWKLVRTRPSGPMTFSSPSQ